MTLSVTPNINANTQTSCKKSVLFLATILDNYILVFQSLPVLHIHDNSLLINGDFE